MIDVTRTVIRCERLPSGFDGFRITLVSDLHDAVFGEEQSELLGRIRETKSDLIALTGDFIGTKKSDVGRMLRFMEKLPGIGQVCYVTGNHEFRLSAEDKERFFRGIRDAGIRFLRNETAMLERKGDEIQIVGVDDPAIIGEGRHPMDGMVLKEELEKASFSPDRFTLLLTHRPEQLPLYAEAGVDLVLCGHSHGGQIRMPGIGALYVPSQGWFPKYDCGLYRERKTQMYISRGLGCSVVNFRISDPPELAVLELRTII